MGNRRSLIFCLLLFFNFVSLNSCVKLKDNSDTKDSSHIDGTSKETDKQGLPPKIEPKVYIDDEETIVDGYMVFENDRLIDVVDIFSAESDAASENNVAREESDSNQRIKQEDDAEEESEDKDADASTVGPGKAVALGVGVLAGTAAISGIAYRIHLYRNMIKKDKDYSKTAYKNTLDASTSLKIGKRGKTEGLKEGDYEMSIPEDWTLEEKPLARAEQSYVFRIKKGDDVHVLKLLRKLDKPTTTSKLQWFFGLKDTPFIDEMETIRSQKELFSDDKRYTKIEYVGENYVIKPFVKGIELKDSFDKDWKFKEEGMRADFKEFIKEMIARDQVTGKFHVLEDLNAGNLMWDTKNNKWRVIDSKPYKTFKTQQEALHYSVERFRDKLRTRKNFIQHTLRGVLGKGEAKNSAPQFDRDGNKSYAWDDAKATLDKELTKIEKEVAEELKIKGYDGKGIAAHGRKILASDEVLRGVGILSSGVRIGSRLRGGFGLSVTKGSCFMYDKSNITTPRFCLEEVEPSSDISLRQLCDAKSSEILYDWKDSVACPPHPIDTCLVSQGKGTLNSYKQRDNISFFCDD